MHYHYVTDARGDVTDNVPFCSDSCHQDWDAMNNLDYCGWNGSHESDYNEYCASCGVIANAGENSCDHQRDNFVVSRFASEDGETCEHGNWIQLPYAMISHR